MKRFLLPLVVGAALLTSSVVANAVTFPFYYNKATKQACLVPTGEFHNARVYWAAITPKGKCNKSPEGGMMNIRYRHELVAGLWKKLKETAAAVDVNTDFTYVYCKQYKGKGSKLRYNFVVTESATGEDLSSGWWPDSGNGCDYDPPLTH